MPVQGQHRAGIVALDGDRQVLPAVRLRQPRAGAAGVAGDLRAIGGARAAGAGQEAERRPVTGPRQRHAAAVPAQVSVTGTRPHRVLPQFGGDVLDLPQTEFLTLVDVGAAGQGQRQQRRGAGPAGAEGQVGVLADPPAGPVERRIGPAVPGDVPDHVVVAEHPGRGGADPGVRLERGVDHRPQHGPVPRAAQEVEVEHRIQLARAQVPAHPLHVGQPHLADQHAVTGVGAAMRRQAR